MSGKDYIQLAYALGSMYRYIHRYIPDEDKPACYACLEQTARHIADVCQNDNRQFNRDKFMTAVRSEKVQV